MENIRKGISGTKYFLQTYEGMQFRHGGIGNLDAEKIIQEEGFRPIRFPDRPSKLVYLKRWIFLEKKLRQISTHDVVLYQFPVYPRMVRIMIRRLQKKGVTLIALIADIDGLKDGDEIVLQKELVLLGHFNNFIVHNKSMETWLRSKLKAPVHTALLGPFDFLATPVHTARSISKTINFSGNLQKSGFLTRLEELKPLQFYLYGEGITPAITRQSNVQYYGIADPHEMPSLIKGSFGLVWDGLSIHGPEGSLGLYMAYIFHHKISLYILAGMPVIAPAFAGSADYIRQQGIGWLVNDLSEISGLINTLTEEEYEAARKKMEPLALEISKGVHLQKALQQLCLGGNLL